MFGPFNNVDIPHDEAQTKGNYFGGTSSNCGYCIIAEGIINFYSICSYLSGDDRILSDANQKFSGVQRIHTSESPSRRTQAMVGNLIVTVLIPDFDLLGNLREKLKGGVGRETKMALRDTRC